MDEKANEIYMILCYYNVWKYFFEKNIRMNIFIAWYIFVDMNIIHLLKKL